MAEQPLPGHLIILHLNTLVHLIYQNNVSKPTSSKFK